MHLAHLRSLRRFILVLLLSSISCRATSATQAQPAPDDAQRIVRLASLARLWGAIKYFHPYLGYREDIDWDKAVVEAIAKVNLAKNAADFSAAVDGMLKALNDPATKVRKIEPARAAGSKGDDPSSRTLGDGILVISLANFGEDAAFVPITQKTAAIIKEIPKARAVIIDLRPPAPLTESQEGGVSIAFDYAGLAGALTSSPVNVPGERRRMHVGFVPQRGPSSGGYESAFFTAQKAMITPAKDGKDLPTVFLVNQYSEIPLAVIALQAAGKAAIVAEGPVNDASFVSTTRMKLADGVEAQVRVGELIYPDGTSGVAADETLAPSSVTGDQNPAFERALALAANFKTAPTHRSHVAASSAVAVEKQYADMAYPAREYRVLAAFRIWTVINYFFPYKDLMKEDWDGVLRDSIPKLEKAGNALQYNLAVAEMVTRFHDGHGFVNSPTMREYLGAAPSPVHVQMLEGMPVIVGFFNDDAAKDAKESGLEIGDVIVKVDGEEAAARLARLEHYMSAATQQWNGWRAANALLSGNDGTTAVVTVRDRNDRLKELKVPRKAAYTQKWTERQGEPYKLLSPSIGYADLDRLEVAMVDDMFEKFKNTRAIIFDDRTYPLGTAWAIAPRLTDKDQVVAALFTRTVPMSPEAPSGEIASSVTSQTFQQRIPHSDKWKYHGKTVMLIDERAISQAEHTGLFLEAANGTKFIGSPTAGANGDVTSFCVPGGIWIAFTGQSVRHADGRQLQRVGLLPDISVRPTLRGIRAGKDEVLDKAIEYLNKAVK